MTTLLSTPEQTRARYPDEEGYASGTACGCSGSGTGRGSRPSCSRRPGRSSTPGSGRARSRTWPGTPGWSPSTPGATAAPTARRLRRLPAARVRRRRPGRAGRGRGRPGGGGLLVRHGRVADPGRRAPRAGRRAGVHRRRRCRLDETETRGATRSTPSPAPTRAGPRRPAATGCATGPGTWSSSSPCASPSRTRPSRSRTASAGRGTPTWRRSWPGSAAGRPRSSTRPRWPRSARGSAARCW